MRLAAGVLLGLVAGPALAGCPYAKRATEAPVARGCPYQARAADADEKVTLPRGAPAEGKQGIFYLNRIGPSGSQLYIANADGSNATKLLGGQANAFDYHPSWSQDGNWIVFTSERRGLGQSDLYRVHPDGTGLEVLAATDSVEDSGVLSPDGTQVAYVSTQGNYTANIWVKNLTTGKAWNLTDTPLTRASSISPTGHFRPSWSPDGQWIAFSSDRNTDWTGHSEGTGWEHTQSLGIYIIHPDGTGLRTLVKQPGFSLSTPQWSHDSKLVLYTNISTEDTYYGHAVPPLQALVSSQVYSVDIAKGTNIVAHTSGPYIKAYQHYIAKTSNIGYLVKDGYPNSINYTVPNNHQADFALANLRNPSWSPDGTKLVYEIPNWTQFPGETELFSYDTDWDYRYMDVFPMLHESTKRLASTQKVLGSANGSLVTSSPLYTDLVKVFDSYDVYDIENPLDVMYLEEGQAGAFQPSWNPDGTELVFGFGLWFATRTAGNGVIYRAKADGSGYTNLTDGTQNAGFPSWSPDGSAIVYRLWDMEASVPLGLHILNFTTGATTQLTVGWDNTPGWSPDGERIVFTRNTNWTESYGSRWYDNRFDIYTIRPDGTDLTRVTDSPANDAHAVWSNDGRIMWSTGMYGFKDECHLFDNTFQPYGQIMVMNYDGSNKKLVTDTIWEDSMPLYVPKSYYE